MKKGKKKKRISHLIVLLIAIPIGRMMCVDRKQSLEGILMFLWTPSLLSRSLLFQICNPFFSNFFLANVHPPERKTTTPTSPIRSTTPVASLRMCENGVLSSTFGLFFGFVHFCPYKEVVRGKPKKGKWLGKIKTKWRQLSPSLTLHPNHLHPPPYFSPTYPDPLPLVPMMVWWWGMTQCASFLTLKKKKSRDGTFLKILFPKDGPPSSMVLLVFLESEKKKEKNFLNGKSA